MQRWSLDHAASAVDNQAAGPRNSSFKSIEMGRSGSGISAFIKHEGANSGVAISSGGNIVMGGIRETRGSDQSFSNFLKYEQAAPTGS